jgi:superfamily II DNA/RNA helicase
VAQSKIDLFCTENSDNETSYDDEVGSDETEEVSLPTSENSKPKKKKVISEDETNAFRNRLQIKARGSDIPKPAATFSEMDIFADLKPIIIGNIEESKWKDPTPIQMQAITVMLKGGLSLCAIYPPLNLSDIFRQRAISYASTIYVFIFILATESADLLLGSIVFSI